MNERKIRQNVKMHRLRKFVLFAFLTAVPGRPAVAGRARAAGVIVAVSCRVLAPDAVCGRLATNLDTAVAGRFGRGTKANGRL